MMIMMMNKIKNPNWRKSKPVGYFQIQLTVRENLNPVPPDFKSNSDRSVTPPPLLMNIMTLVPLCLVHFPAIIMIFSYL